MTLAGDSATAGTDFHQHERDITYEDGTTATVASMPMVPSTLRPAAHTTFQRSRRDNRRSEYEAMNLHAKRSDSDSASAVTGTATQQRCRQRRTDDRQPCRPSDSEVAEGETATFRRDVEQCEHDGDTVT
ncbi:hypothetical protein HPK20_15710 [Vibrio fluvialis]|uniref:hypothetical protein n=1 Tax=Vibrio fluvialis TaxID=676 RepID=UPI0015988CE5|nr:hypothetical protein [Vibrio fluvialis]QKE35945.1 hypothetical protein HPK20_15710 [Vibrio fluvialis]